MVNAAHLGFDEKGDLTHFDQLSSLGTKGVSDQIFIKSKPSKGPPTPLFDRKQETGDRRRDKKDRRR